MNFLDQINEKPQQFTFDVQPYLQSSLKNVLKKSQQLADESPETPKKFFDFDLKRKRGVKSKNSLDYSFNDGSVPIDEIITKFQPKRLLTPQDVEQNYQLEESFKELHLDEHEHIRPSPEIPFYKTEQIGDEYELEALPWNEINKKIVDIRRWVKSFVEYKKMIFV